MPSASTMIMAADYYVAGLSEVNLVFNHVAHTYRGDHTVEHHGYAADGSRRHYADESRKLGAEAEHYGKHCRYADYEGVINLAECKHAGVFAVSGVGRGAEQGGEGGCRPSPSRVRMRPGSGYEVAFAGGGYGANVADMLNHGGEGKGRYGEDRGHEQAVSRSGLESRPITVFCIWKGRPIQAASLTGVKSTSPQMAATM